MIAASGLEVVKADGDNSNKCERWLGRTVQYSGIFREHVTSQDDARSRASAAEANSLEMLDTESNYRLKNADAGTFKKTTKVYMCRIVGYK